MGTVYAIVIDKFIKIGYTASFSKRMTAYKVGFPPGLAVLLGTREYEDSRDAYGTEQSLHLELDEYRIGQREWFEYRPEVVEVLYDIGMVFTHTPM